MTDQKFKYAGYSVTDKCQHKARFGNDMVSRVKKLTAGNTDIWFSELPKEMTKQEAAEHLLQDEKYNSNFEISDALLKVIYRNTPKVTRIVNQGVVNATVSSDNNGGE